MTQKRAKKSAKKSTKNEENTHVRALAAAASHRVPGVMQLESKGSLGGSGSSGRVAVAGW
jgi:hypothetical protein